MKSGLIGWFGSRTGFGWAVAFLVGSCAPTEAQPSRLTQEQRIEVKVNLVTLRFTVRNDQGQFVNTLKRDQFRVFENQKRQDIAFFEPPHNAAGTVGPLWLAFLLDVSGSTFATRSEEIIAAQTFFDNIYQFAQLGIFGFTDRLIVFQDFTSSRELALKAFGTAREHLGRTAIYDSLLALISRMNARATEADRKVIILISDAMDDAYAKSGQTVSLARASNVSIYTVLVPSAAQLYIGGSMESASEAGNSHDPGQNRAAREKAFAELSSSTSGKHYAGFETILDFDQTLAQINDDVYGNLYTFGYYTDDPYLAVHEREIRVEVDSPGVHVSALFKNLPERLTAKKKFIEALFENEPASRLPEDLRAGFREVGAELDVLPSKREGAQMGLPFRIKISPYTLRGSEKEGVRTQFGVIGALVDRQGREVLRLREFFRVTLSSREIREGRGIIYTNKLMAPPGIYHLRLALLELASWKLTTFEEQARIVEE